MPSLDVHRPGMPGLQFVLVVIALCTSGLSSLNAPEALRALIFDRCWALLHQTPPPTRPEKRVLDLRMGTEVALDAMVKTIRSLLTDAGITVLTWDHLPSEPTLASTPQALPLIERFEKLYPARPDSSESEGLD